MDVWILQYGSKRYEIGKTPLVIGRADECGVQLDDPSVSRRHASIELGPNGPVISDVGSKSGVRVNGTLVPPNGRRELAHGDRVGINAHEMVVQEIERLGREKAQTIEMPRGPRERLVVAAARELKPTDETEPVLRLLGEIEAAVAGGVVDPTPVRALLLTLANRPPGESDESLLRRASTLALRAATNENRTFIDQVVALHAARGILMHASTLDGLEGALGRVPTAPRDALRKYAEQMRAALGARPSSEYARFCLQRLSALVA